MKNKKTWLIKWGSPSDTKPRSLNSPIVLAFFDGRKSPSTIRHIITGLYLASDQLNIQDKIDYGLTKERKRMLKLNENSRMLACGINPYIIALLVTNLKVDKTEKDRYEVSWTIDKFNYNQTVYHNLAIFTPLKFLISKN